MKHRLTPSIAMVLLLPVSAMAQTVAGFISGLVTDASSAAVAEADIEVRDLDRSTVFKAVGNASGFYVVTPLPPDDIACRPRERDSGGTCSSRSRSQRSKRHRSTFRSKWAR